MTFGGQSLLGKTPAEIARMGVGYVPQGRRLWPSLTVDEHLQMVATEGAWSIDRIYAPSRASPSAGAMAAASFPAASSRCWRSRGHFCSTRRS